VLSRYIVIYCHVIKDRLDRGGEMYGRGMMGYAGGRRAMVPYGRGFRPRFPVGLVVGGLFLLFVVGPAFHFFHFFPFFLILAVPFLLVPAFAAAARGLAGITEARTRERTGRATAEQSKERELLGALARRGELSPALAALETSLSVSEADRMLSDLAESGHLEVRAHEGRIGYALWEHDRRQLTEGE
jgi:hypothetical protein